MGGYKYMYTLKNTYKLHIVLLKLTSHKQGHEGKGAKFSMC